MVALDSCANYLPEMMSFSSFGVRPFSDGFGGPPRFACQAGSWVRAARGGSGVALAPLCGSRDVSCISDFSLRVGAVWGFCPVLVPPRGACQSDGCLRNRGTSCHPRPGGKIFILFPVISSIRQITFIRNTGPGENFCPQYRFRFSDSPGYRHISQHGIRAQALYLSNTR